MGSCASPPAEARRRSRLAETESGGGERIYFSIDDLGDCAQQARKPGRARASLWRPAFRAAADLSARSRPHSATCVSKTYRPRP